MAGESDAAINYMHIEPRSGMRWDAHAMRAQYLMIQTGVDGPVCCGGIGWLNVFNIPAKVTAGLGIQPG